MLLDQSDNEIKVHRINIRKGDGTDEKLLTNINGPFTETSVKATHNIDGTKIYGSAYALEDIQGSVDDGDGDDTDPDDPNNPGTGTDDPEQPIEVTNAEIIEVLDENYLYNIWYAYGKYAIGTTYDRNKISDIVWYLATDTNKNILTIECRYNFARTSTSSTFIIGKAHFDTPISVEDLKKNDVADVKYSSSYTYIYEPSVQESRIALTNAICDKVFGKDVGATRYLYDAGSWLDSELHQSHSFKVCQISENKVNECYMAISHISPDGYDNVYDDEGYIRQLNYSNKYMLITKESQEISGAKLEYNDERFDTTINATKNTASNEQIKNALNLCLDKIYSVMPLVNVNKALVRAGVWRVKKDSYGNILKAEYAFFYNAGNSISDANSVVSYWVATIDFSTPMNYEDIIANNNSYISKAAFNISLIFKYSSASQYPLTVSAVLADNFNNDNTVNGYLTGARSGALYPENGTGVDSWVFTIYFVNGDGEVSSIGLMIKTSSSDAEFANNYKNGHYYISGRLSSAYQFAGEKL